MANIREFDSHVVGFFGFFGFCIDKVIPEGLSAKVLAYVDMVYTVSLKTIEETGHVEDQKKKKWQYEKTIYSHILKKQEINPAKTWNRTWDIRSFFHVLVTKILSEIV